MHANERRGVGKHGAISLHQRDVQIVFVLRGIEQHRPRSVLGRKRGLHQALDERFGAPAMANQIFDRDDAEPVLAREPQKIGKPRHGAVFVQDLAENSRFAQSRHARQVHGGFGVPGATQHAALRRAQRKDVSGKREVRRARARVGELAQRGGAIRGGDAGGGAFDRVDRDRERSAEERRVAIGHGTKLEAIGDLRSERRAKNSAAVAGDEVHRLGGRLFGGHDEVAFVLAILVVDDDHDTSGANLVDRLFHRIQDARLRARGRRLGVSHRFRPSRIRAT